MGQKSEHHILGVLVTKLIFKKAEKQSLARDNFFASRQRQHDNVLRLLRQATTRQILASWRRDNVFPDNVTATTILLGSPVSALPMKE